MFNLTKSGRPTPAGFFLLCRIKLRNGLIYSKPGKPAL